MTRFLGGDGTTSRPPEKADGVRRVDQFGRTGRIRCGVVLGCDCAWWRLQPGMDQNLSPIAVAPYKASWS